MAIASDERNDAEIQPLKLEVYPLLLPIQFLGAEWWFPTP